MFRTILTSAVFFALTLTVKAEMRTWTSLNKRHTCRAEFINMDGSRVILKMEKTGKLEAVEVTGLIDLDWTFIKSKAGTLNKARSSFRVWTDQEDRQVIAEFIEVSGTSVRVKMPNGAKKQLPLKVLSKADKDWLSLRGVLAVKAEPQKVGSIEPVRVNPEQPDHQSKVNRTEPRPKSKVRLPVVTVSPRSAFSYGKKAVASTKRMVKRDPGVDLQKADDGTAYFYLSLENKIVSVTGQLESLRVTDTSLVGVYKAELIVPTREHGSCKVTIFFGPEDREQLLTLNIDDTVTIRGYMYQAYSYYRGFYLSGSMVATSSQADR